MLKTYVGSCHCGAVTFGVDVDLSSVLVCNCSICSRKGYMLAFVAADAFRLTSGENATTDYQFNKKEIHHRFCKVCGVTAFADGADAGGKKMIAVNVRTLEEVDLAALTIKHYDGKSS